jgi:hypothetical protein
MNMSTQDPQRKAAKIAGAAFLLTLALVMAVNLGINERPSASVSAAGPDAKSEFEKNLTAVSRLVEALPAGAHVTILSITEESFSEPCILLSAELIPDTGYFQERLAKDRGQISQAWQKRMTELAPRSQKTDLVGDARPGFAAAHPAATEERARDLLRHAPIHRGP